MYKSKGEFYIFILSAYTDILLIVPIILLAKNDFLHIFVFLLLLLLGYRIILFVMKPVMNPKNQNKTYCSRVIRKTIFL